MRSDTNHFCITFLAQTNVIINFSIELLFLIDMNLIKEFNTSLGGCFTISIAVSRSGGEHVVGTSVETLFFTDIISSITNCDN